MSLISGLLNKLFGSKEFRGLMLGLDASGRTTLLYRCFLGEIVTTIPTIGFNVETIRIGSANLTLWDVGGCDRIRPLWRHYYEGADLGIFFIDSNDHQRFEEAVDEFNRLFNELQDMGYPLAFIIFANKQDLKNPMSVEKIEKALGIATKNKIIPCRVFPVSATTTPTSDILAMLSWGCDEITASKAAGKKPKEAVPKKDDTPQEEDILTRWLKVVDEPDDEFLEKFTSYKLETWDHRVHLRIAWVYLNKLGRREGMKKIFEGIKNFIEHSGRANKTKFHETLTYFWVHMVHYAMVATANPNNDFKTFLLMNPQLSNGGLFFEYFTKDHIMSQEGRSSVVLPDKKPLPSIVSTGGGRPQPLQKDPGQESSSSSSSSSSAPASSSSSSSSSSSAVKKTYDETQDGDFIEAFEARQLKKWNHEYLIRVIFLYLQKLGRKEGMNKIFAEMQGLMKAGFHYTRTYFWIHLVDYATTSAGKPAQLSAVIAKHKELLDEQLPLKYFDKAALDSDQATQSMIPPKKALPSILS